MPGKKSIVLRPSLFNWHMNTRETRHTVMPLMNDIRRYPLMRSLEQTLSSKVNQGIISKDLAGRFFRDLIADIGRKVYDIDVDSKKIEKIRHESKTQREGLRRIVHLALDEGAIPKDGIYFTVNVKKERKLEGSAKMVDNKPVIKLLIKLK